MLCLRRNENVSVREGILINPICVVRIFSSRLFEWSYGWVYGKEGKWVGGPIGGLWGYRAEGGREDGESRCFVRETLGSCT